MAMPTLAQDEWEYEYEQNETEDFLIDLDLTTANRNFKSTTANRHKRLADVKGKALPRKKQKTLKDTKSTKTPSTNEAAAAGNAADDVDAQEGDEGARLEDDRLGDQQAAEADGDADEDSIPTNGLQILDLHTGNPVVAYKGQVFSCTWVDTVGTTMFFSEPRDTPLYDPDISTEDFDLIGLSRIKLVGREAKVTPIVQKDKGKEAATKVEPAGKSLGTIRRSNAKVNADLRKQANFLEQLMNVKKNRGENDNVHVVMNDSIAKSIAEGKLKSNILRKEQLIDELNRKVVRGDAEALRRLELIYTGQDADGFDDDGDGDGAQEATEELQYSLRTRRRRINIIESDAEFEVEEELGSRVIGTASPSSGSPNPDPNVSKNATNENMAS